jgi:hypothetical protein
MLSYIVNAVKIFKDAIYYTYHTCANLFLLLFVEFHFLILHLFFRCNHHRVSNFTFIEKSYWLQFRNFSLFIFMLR